MICSRISEIIASGNFLEVEGLVKKALKQEIKSEDVAQAILDGIEKGERDAYGDVTFLEGINAVANISGYLTYETARRAYKVLKPHLKPHLDKTLVIGMAKYDYHHQGKDYVAMAMELAGFKVYDLGCEAGPEDYVQAIKEYDADVVGISSLYTEYWIFIRDTIKQIKNSGLRERVAIILGGTMLRDGAKIFGADAYAPCATIGVQEMKYFTGIEEYDPEENPGLFTNIFRRRK